MHTQTDNRIRAAAHAFQKTTASMLVTWFVSGSTDPRQETIRYDPTLPLSSRLLTGYTRTSRSEPLGELLRPENTCHMPRNLGLKERRHLSKSSSEGFRTPSKEPSSVTQFHEVERTRRVSQGGVFGGTFCLQRCLVSLTNSSASFVHGWRGEYGNTTVRCQPCFLPFPSASEQ